MNLLDNRKIELHIHNLDYLNATVAQLEKDFAMLDLEIQIDLSEDKPYERFRRKMEDILQFLIEKNDDKLANLLYRIDLSEETIRQNSARDEDFTSILADLIIRRELMKVIIRREFS
jgi:DNA polymerase III delta prime subunit